MVGHVLDLSPPQRRELLTLLTQERAEVQTDEEVLAELSETLRRQLSLAATTDLTEGFRRRMIRIIEELADGPVPGTYDFMSERAIANEVLKQVEVQALGAEGEFLAEFAKTFRTMSQDRRAAWLREAALAASAAKYGEADAQRATDAAHSKTSAELTAARIAAEVALARSARSVGKSVAVSTKTAASVAGASAVTLTAAAAPLGLLAGGAVAFAIRRKRKKTRDADVQVRRERQATQAVVTTCAYMLAALPEA